MAHHKSTKKRIITSKKQNLRNRSYKSAYKTAVKRVLQSDSKETALNEYRKAESVIDKLTSKGIIHHNRAARKKSQLARYINNNLV